MKVLYTSFKTTDAFEDIAVDNLNADIEVRLPSVKDMDKLISVLPNFVRIIYSSPDLSIWYSPGDETTYDHMPYYDFRIVGKENWNDFTKFFKKFMVENDFIRCPITKL